MRRRSRRTRRHGRRTPLSSPGTSRRQAHPRRGARCRRTAALRGTFAHIDAEARTSNSSPVCSATYTIASHARALTGVGEIAHGKDYRSSTLYTHVSCNGMVGPVLIQSPRRVFCRSPESEFINRVRVRKPLTRSLLSSLSAVASQVLYYLSVPLAWIILTRAAER